MYSSSQIAATMIDSNEFLIHLLNRFGVMNWARVDYETKYLNVSSHTGRNGNSLLEIAFNQSS